VRPFAKAPCQWLAIFQKKKGQLKKMNYQGCGNLLVRDHAENPPSGHAPLPTGKNRLFFKGVQADWPV